MNQPLAIRIATRADLPTLIQLYQTMDSQATDGTAIGSEAALPETIATALFDQISQIPTYFLYIADYNHQPIGTFSLVFIPTLMHRGFHKYAIIDAVAVSPAHRGQGFGKAMMQAALHLSQAAGCYKVMLSSNLKRDRAHAFYESLGFQQHGWSFSLQLPALDR